MIIQRIFIIAIILKAIKSQEEDVYLPHTSSQNDSWKFGSVDTMNKSARAIVKKVLSVEQGEGVGARVRRSVGRQEVS